MKGPLCWVELPTDAWPPEVQYWKFRRPVVRLDKALYGHPDSGTMWEQHCDKKVQEIGFKPIGEEWPSMYFHDELKLLLVIYVDDLKLAGPSENLAKGWEMLRTVLRIEPETDLCLYLGCVLSQGEPQLHNGKKVKTLTYNMEGLLKLSVEKYLDIIGKDTKLKKVSTPSLPEETKSSPYRAPSDGKRKVECPWCAQSFDPEMPVLHETDSSRPGQDSESLNRGNLAPHAASVLMKLFYAARIARFDLLRSINALARNVTKWTKDDDALTWKQYLRRLTFHAALSFNMLTEGQLDSHMLNENDYEWLKLYHYIITSTELVRCKGYPVTKVLAMLTLGVEDTVGGNIRNKLKKLGSQIGQFIIGKPWLDHWDELGGQVRNNKSLILTDLTYQTRSSSKAIHNIEAGLNNMGLSFVKVYQLPYQSLEKPEEFLQLAKNALNFLRTNATTLTSVTVHIWISFASLFRGQSRTLVPDDGFVVKLADIISDISQNTPLPIFVNILKDARFLGSQSSIVSIAEEFAGILKNKGIMHSTNERFWKQIFA